MSAKHTHNRKVRFKLHGKMVSMTILAYREIDDGFMWSCVEDVARSYKRKKLKTDIKVVYPTLYGATGRL